MTRLNGSSPARWIGAVMASTVFAAGCSSSPDDTSADTTAVTSGDTAVAVTTDSTAAPTDEPPTDTTEPSAGDTESGRSPSDVTLIDAGSEPRVTLEITADARSRIAVDASEALDTTLDGVTTSTVREAAYQLDIDIQSGSDGIQMLVAPTILSIDGPVPTPDELGTWRWGLDPHGVFQWTTPVGRDDSISRDTLELLGVTQLVLATPAEPVGPGAQWSQSLNRANDTRLEFTLNDVTDTDLVVVVEFLAESDRGTATMTATGTYDRATLLARGVTTDVRLEAGSPVSDNGVLVELTGVQHSRRTYTEVQG